MSSSEERRYLLHVPKIYDRSKPTPLVISLHPAALGPTAQMETTGWNQLADEHGFIVVYPAGSGRPTIWHAQKPGPALDADIKFISDLIDKLEGLYNIDPARIYVNGFSNGGGMAFALSCRLSPRIAAFGEVAAAIVLPQEWCADANPVAMIAFHGTADKLAPYLGGKSSGPGIKQPLSPVQGWTGAWARRNRCVPDPLDAQVTGSVRSLTYSNCAEHADVILYTIAGGGHSWPGGKPLLEWMAGPPSREIDATKVMWDFFVQHPRPPK